MPAPNISEDELNDMPRRDLQALCKDAGIKANLKTADLIEQLKIWIKSSNGLSPAPEPQQGELVVENEVEVNAAPITAEVASEVAAVEEEVAVATEEEKSSDKKESATADERIEIGEEEEAGEEEEEGEVVVEYDRLAAHKQSRKEASKKKGQ